MRLLDEKTGLLLLDEVVESLPSYQKIIGDARITDEEIIEQNARVVGLLQRIDEELSEADRDLVVSAIAELAALYHLAMRKEGL